MKTARIDIARMKDDTYLDVLKKKGFDMDRPFKSYDHSADPEPHFKFVQHDCEDVEVQDATTCELNQSGILPVEYKVLISRPEVQGKTEGGVFIPEAVVEKEKMRRVVGVLVARGGNAFEDWKPPIPKVRQRVRVAKYVGEFFEGMDGQPYQLCSDKDISSIVSEEWQEMFYPSGQPDGAGDGEFAHLRTSEDPEAAYSKHLEKSKPGSDRIKVYMAS